MTDQYEKEHKQVTTWLSVQDYNSLFGLASKNNVNMAAYVRAIIVDVIQEELLLAEQSVNCISKSNQIVV